MKQIELGTKVSDFVLSDHRDREFKLSEQRGKVMLSFHPLAWTGICAKQMKSLEDNHDVLKTLGCTAVGMSVDSAPCKKAWAEHLDIEKTPLLADFWPHGGVANSLGLFRQEEGFSQRANVIIEDSVIIFCKVYDLGELPDIVEVIDFLKEKR